MPAEQTQELGRRGVFEVKAWLESTTHLVMPFNAYETGPACTRVRLDGGTKCYDLAGSFLGQPRRPALVEAKNYTSAGRQAVEYREFLANAYSITVKELITVGDTGTEFIWVTTHPFNVTGWSTLTSRRALESAVMEHADWLGPVSDIDQDILNTVSARIWLLVRHERQNEISLTRAELHRVFPYLERSPL